MPPARDPLSWKMILIYTALTAVAAGLLMGLLTQLTGLSPGIATGGVGGATGAVGALLISRRRAEQAALRK